MPRKLYLAPNFDDDEPVSVIVGKNKHNRLAYSHEIPLLSGVTSGEIQDSEWLKLDGGRMVISGKSEIIQLNKLPILNQFSLLFPYAFVDNPSVNLTIQQNISGNGYLMPLIVQLIESEKKEATFQLTNLSSLLSDNTVQVHYQAMGRWK